jgi:hypothetical protein
MAHCGSQERPEQKWAIEPDFGRVFDFLRRLKVFEPQIVFKSSFSSHIWVLPTVQWPTFARKTAQNKSGPLNFTLAESFIFWSI